MVLMERRCARRSILFDPIMGLALETLDLPMRVADRAAFREMIPHCCCAGLFVL